MFRKILYPTDFSDCAVKALEYVKKLKEAGTEEVVAVHVMDVREIETMAAGVAWLGETTAEYETDLLTAMRDDVEKKLEGVRMEIEKAGLKVSVKIPEGILFKKILKIAEDEDVSLIVLGSHGKSNVREMLLGSVSEKVIRGSKRPVLVVKRDRA
ncbi:MAG: universal stress protein [Candidatus Methanospirareceae archaeon]